MNATSTDTDGHGSAGALSVMVCVADPGEQDTLAAELRANGYLPVGVADAADCPAAAERHAPVAIVLDVGGSLATASSALRALRRRQRELPVVALLPNGAVHAAVQATRLGARALLQRPFEPSEVRVAVDRVLARERSRNALDPVQRLLLNIDPSDEGAPPQVHGHGDFIGRSEALAQLLGDLRRLESVSAPTVLVLGESGTGKDVVARTLHARGPRSGARLVEVDCSALPEHLVESELFGHERGAFTDASSAKQGLFEVAAGGTVFLDEIGELPLPTQAKLLRALENRRFRRVGGVANLKLEACVIAATNRDLRKEVAAGRFREDLLFRLDVVTLRIPPLRHRRDDIPLLAAHFLERLERDFGRGIEGVDPEALARLVSWEWPGNVRELKNVLERAALLGGSRRITLDDLPVEIRLGRPAPRAEPSAGLAHDGFAPAHAGGVPGDLPEYWFELPAEGLQLDRVERDFVVQALRRTRGQQSAAARLLGITRFQLRSRIEKYGLGDVGARAEPAGDGSPGLSSGSASRAPAGSWPPAPRRPSDP